MIQDGGPELFEHLLCQTQIRDNDKAHRMKIIHRLGGLALAIDQAAAYICSTRSSLSGFLEGYERTKYRVLQQRGTAFGYSKTASDAEEEFAVVASTTWEMSLEQLEYKQRKHIEDFLSASAFLQASSISDFVFRECYQGQDDVPEWLVHFMRQDQRISDDNARHRPAWDDASFSQVLRQLEQLSLIQLGDNIKTGDTWYKLHLVIRDWLQIRLVQKKEDQAHHDTLRLITPAVENTFDDEQHIDRKQELLGHVDAISRHASTSERSVYGKPFAWFYIHENQPEKAIPLLARIVDSKESKLARSSPTRIFCLFSLGCAYSDNDQNENAVPLFEEVLNMKQRQPKSHPERLQAQLRLAAIYLKSGQTRKAIAILQSVDEVVQFFNESHPRRRRTHELLVLANFLLSQEMGTKKRTEVSRRERYIESDTTSPPSSRLAVGMARKYYRPRAA